MAKSLADTGFWVLTEYLL